MSSFLQRILDLIRVNPSFRSSMLPVDKFRHPSPASQPEYKAPTSSASNISKNPYYQRDARRQYPTTQTISAVNELEPKPHSNENGNLLRRYKYQVAKEQPPASPDAYFPIHNQY
jgi:hypothetical protein